MSRHVPPDVATVAQPVARDQPTSSAGQPARAGDKWPAVVLAAASVIPAVVLGVWLIVAIPLLALGAFRPGYAIPLFLALVVPTFVLAGGPLIRRAAGSMGNVPGWTVLSVFAAAVAFAVTNGLLHSEKVILRRDAAAYSLIGHWLAHHSEKVVPSGIGAFGGPDQGLNPASQGFYPHGDMLVPQFMSGLPATLAAAEWGSSWRATLWVPAVLGGLALLAFAGLAARLLGARWAVAAVVALALVEPFWQAARETLSEPLASVLIIGGLGLVADAARAPPGRSAGRLRPAGTGLVAHVRGVFDPGTLAAATGGALIAISSAVRLDSLREATLVVPVAGWLAARRSPAWRGLAIGVALGLAVGALDGWVLTRPYVMANRSSLVPLGWLLAALVVASAAGAIWVRRRTWRPPGWLASVVAWGIVAAGAGFAVRPLVQTVHRTPAGSQLAADIARLQRGQGLRVDPGRSYDEMSLHWLAWWVGWFTVAVTVVGAAFLARAILTAVSKAPGDASPKPATPGTDEDHISARPRLRARSGVPLEPPRSRTQAGGLPELSLSRAQAGDSMERPPRPEEEGRTPGLSASMWVPPLLIVLGTTAATLWRPGISPDHPWADRRFVPVVLPGVILLALWAVRHLSEHLRATRIRLGPRGLAQAGLAAGCAGVLGPIVWASAPLIGSRVEVGSMTAIEQACAAVGPRDVVFFVNGRGAAEWPAVMKIACGVRSAVVRPGDPPTLARLAYRAKAAGSQPVLMTTGTPGGFAQLGTATTVVSVTSSEDQHLLERRPTHTQPLRFQLWLIRL